MGVPFYLLDLRTVPSGAVAEWASGRASTKFVDLVGPDGTDGSTNTPLSQWIDVIVHVQNSTPAQHF